MTREERELVQRVADGAGTTFEMAKKMLLGRGYTSTSQTAMRILVFCEGRGIPLPEASKAGFRRPFRLRQYRRRDARRVASRAAGRQP